MNRKGDGTVIVVLVIVLLLFLGYLYNMAMRQCNNNSDCGEGMYCGSDFACHDFPNVIEKRENSLLLPSIILGLSFIIAAFIVRGWKLKQKETQMFHDFSDMQK